MAKYPDAPSILREAAATIEQRSTIRDKQGLRSLALAAIAFNALRGTSLTEEDVCVLLTIVKLARASHGSDPDNFVDGAAYLALAAEAHAKERK